MFAVITILITLGILTSLYYIANNKEQGVSRKYRLLCLLREIMNLCRRHRALTHKMLVGNQDYSAEITQAESQLKNKLEALIATAHINNKPTYRILQMDILRLINGWKSTGIARNQSEHGRVIRCCMFLMDEITMAWLIEEKQTYLAEHYHQSWQALVDGVETLTQFRICIQELNQPQGKVRAEHCSAIMLKRLNTLARMNPSYMSSAASIRAQSYLNGVVHDGIGTRNEAELYNISSDISLALSNTYDVILMKIIDKIYFPLPNTNHEFMTHH